MTRLKPLPAVTDRNQPPARPEPDPEEMLTWICR